MIAYMHVQASLLCEFACQYATSIRLHIFLANMTRFVFGWLRAVSTKRTWSRKSTSHTLTQEQHTHTCHGWFSAFTSKAYARALRCARIMLHHAYMNPIMSLHGSNHVSNIHKCVCRIETLLAALTWFWLLWFLNQVLGCQVALKGSFNLWCLVLMCEWYQYQPINFKFCLYATTSVWGVQSCHAADINR